MKIPFSIDYRPQIESGEYKLETESGNPAFVMDWDWNWDGEKCLAVKVPGLGRDNALLYHFNGERASIFPSEKSPALFIITPEEELNEIEKWLVKFYNDRNSLSPDKDGVYNRHDLDELLHNTAAELLSLAREQFIKDGYVIEKKAFHDAVEKIDDKHKAEMSVEYSLHCKVENGTRRAVMNWEEFQKVAQHFINRGKANALKEFEEKYKQSWFNEGKIAGRYEGLSEDEKYQQGVHDGKEEALKDLPRWKISRAMRSTMPTVMWGDNGMILYKDGFEISISDLENLPKENEK